MIYPLHVKRHDSGYVVVTEDGALLAEGVPAEAAVGLVGHLTRGVPWFLWLIRQRRVAAALARRQAGCPSP